MSDLNLEGLKTPKGAGVDIHFENEKTEKSFKERCSQEDMDQILLGIPKDDDKGEGTTLRLHVMFDDLRTGFPSKKNYSEWTRKDLREDSDIFPLTSFLKEMEETIIDILFGNIQELSFPTVETINKYLEDPKYKILRKKTSDCVTCLAPALYCDREESFDLEVLEETMAAIQVEEGI